jgi:hypothetical protein
MKVLPFGTRLPGHDACAGRPIGVAATGALLGWRLALGTETAQSAVESAFVGGKGGREYLEEDRHLSD